MLSLFLLSTFIYAQENKINGKVIDATSKLPLTGVSISIKNSTTGTSTDADGNFSLEAPNNSKILVTFVGYEAVEINASQKKLCYST